MDFVIEMLTRIGDKCARLRELAGVVAGRQAVQSVMLSCHGFADEQPWAEEVI
jgi:hypothetical protein